MKLTRASHIGEVIASSTSLFVSQALQDPETGERHPPHLGSLVKAHHEISGLQILGIVCQVESNSLDGVHRPVALQLTRQELREQQPQIFDLLHLEFQALIVGYWEKGRYYQSFPPYPPQIHDFTYLCANEEIIRFSERLFFLRNLLETPGIHDEITAAFLRQAWQARAKQGDFLLNAGRELAALLKEDYDRLRSIVSRLQH